MTRAGIYVHVPFCTRRCDYCDFYVTVGRGDQIGRYAARLVEEIRSAGERPGEESVIVDSLYLGGGTPSLLSPEQVEGILDACRAGFDVEPGAEVTLEANPEGIDAVRLEGWLESGVNRLSIGLQSTRDATLKARGRLHTGLEGLEAISAAHRAGFDNVGADLIAGLPSGEPGGSATEEILESLRSVVARRPEHVSLYLLETDKETPLMAAVREGRIGLPGDDEVAGAYEAACLLLAQAGYEHYEISSFCLPGRRSRHNLKYWTGAPFLGFGPSAFSSRAGRLWSISRDLDAFLGGRSREESHTPATVDAVHREALILNLRLLEGVNLAAFDQQRGTSFASSIAGELDDLIEAGCVELDEGTLRLTRRGLLLANEVFGRIASPAGVGHHEAERGARETRSERLREPPDRGFHDATAGGRGGAKRATS